MSTIENTKYEIHNGFGMVPWSYSFEIKDGKIIAKRFKGQEPVDIEFELEATEKRIKTIEEYMSWDRPEQIRFESLFEELNDQRKIENYKNK